jgi:hypothetical protein
MNLRNMFVLVALLGFSLCGSGCLYQQYESLNKLQVINRVPGDIVLELYDTNGHRLGTYNGNNEYVPLTVLPQPGMETFDFRRLASGQTVWFRVMGFSRIGHVYAGDKIESRTFYPEEYHWNYDAYGGVEYHPHRLPPLVVDHLDPPNTGNTSGKYRYR